MKSQPLIISELTDLNVKTFPVLNSEKRNDDGSGISAWNFEF